MSYKLEKPYTDIQRADFVCEHQGLNYYEDGNCIIMYSDNESVTGGIVTDISDTPEYIKSQRLIQIDIELSQASIDHATAMDTEVIYPINGKTYKPKYAAENYSWFFQAENIAKAINPNATIFPVFIKDSTKLNANGENMSIAELTQLTAFLAQICDNLWTAKSNKENDLLGEKALLQD